MPIQAMKLIILAFLCVLLSSCADPTGTVSHLLKTDIDMVTDTNLRQVENLVQELAVKLYRRNPRELRKGVVQKLDGRLNQLFGRSSELLFPELNHQRGVSALLLCFEPEFTGDRVFALLVGLLSMLRHAYNDQPEFFMLDSLDQQKLYNSARNIEILVWRLNHRLDAQGGPYLLTNSLPGEPSNLSFERLFGKLIAHQDLMAQIVAKKWQRTINLMVKSVARAAFLPVGI